VLFLPKGLAGLYHDHIKVWFNKWRSKSSSPPEDSEVLPSITELKKEVPDAK